MLRVDPNPDILRTLNFLNSSMLQLTDDLLIATGRRRNCYRHPDDPDKCVKVSHLAKGRDMQARRETKYYCKYMRRGCSMEHLAAFHGQVETNLGPGIMFDLITNPDGELSTTLGACIRGGTPIQTFEAEFKKIFDYMVKEGIIVGDFNESNILVQQRKDGSRHLVIIDGVGNSDFIKLADYSKSFRNKKLHRKWGFLMRQLGRFEKMAKAGKYPGNSPEIHPPPTSRPSAPQQHSASREAISQQ